VSTGHRRFEVALLCQDKAVQDNFHSRTMHLDIIKVFYSPTDTKVNCFKNSIKIYIKTSPTCFGAVTPSSGNALFVLAKVTVVKRVLENTSLCG